LQQSSLLQPALVDSAQQTKLMPSAKKGYNSCSTDKDQLVSHTPQHMYTWQ